MEPGRLRILITGSGGFLGGHLFSQLKESNTQKQLKLYSVARTSNSIQTRGCDLSEKTGVDELLRSVRPSKIYHCAGSTTNNFEEDYKSNVLTTFYLLQTIKELNLPCRILLIGSSGEYGTPESSSGFISEDHPLNPVSVYGLTKVFQTQLMKYYHNNHGLDVVMARIFNLDGDGISPVLFPGRVRSQIRDYLDKKITKIKVGNLSSYRDYLPVEDAILDLMTIMEKGKPGEVYNVGSSRPIQMRDFLQQLLTSHNIDMNAVEIDPEYGSKSSRVSIIASDLTKIKALKAMS